ncbi:hypothetical protein CFC21_013947 [Triticum aestivum]|uniref:Avr9/Cf-9 rapidly elicited protein n=3 Tax=Triticinae TaxID=1648030 RepID=A0A9R1IYM1_WHEAT|nr:uncharacterized protein LOC109764819 [Aegilops tauschii subsp. strangulata]XP_044447048.1 uncharacterized protein LOC123177262 [Triticum aestivum]KAF6997760.1 hypothetical protein CFC21_013945 [Triticum aestivum]KAF6997762.1 hypothetical protein CFC21_013947 [Triticum aestivum]
MAVKVVAGKTTAAQPKTVGRRLWRLARTVVYLLRRGVLSSGRKLAMDLHRSRDASKALGGFVNFHRRAAARSRSSSVAAKCLDDEAAGCYNSYDAADIARVFEMLNDSGHLFHDEDGLAAATPSSAAWASPAFGRSAATGQLRIIDSPFTAGEHQQVDRKADEFIRRFYQQLRAQKSVSATPENYGHVPRPVAA